MKQLQLKGTSILLIPTTRRELELEPIMNKHERWLRSMINQNKTPIYIGDEVEVSSRWLSEGRNPYVGRVGTIIGLEAGSRGEFDIDYLIFRVKPSGRGHDFQTYHYTLNLLDQSLSNQTLENKFRNTNKEFERYMGGV